MDDNVNKPEHYQGEIECIECIKASMTKIEFLGYLKGNAQKYIWRYRNKNGLEDLKLPPGVLLFHQNQPLIQSFRILDQRAFLGIYN